MPVEFIVLTTHNSQMYAEMELECPICGSDFSIDTETELNMTQVCGDWLTECPECGFTCNVV